MSACGTKHKPSLMMRLLRLCAMDLLGWRRKAEGAGGRTMRDVAEYRKRAEDCRQQALKLATQPDHWGHL
jgi:hypothetical protein